MESPRQEGLTTAELIKGMTHTKTSSIYYFPCSDCGKKILRDQLAFSLSFILAVLLVNKTITISLLHRHLSCLFIASAFYHSILNLRALGHFWFMRWLLYGLWSDSESAILVEVKVQQAKLISVHISWGITGSCLRTMHFLVLV